MNKNDLYRAFNDVDDDILLRSEAPVRRRKSIVRIKWIALAACLVLIISMVGVACAAEVKEYSAAVDFFEQNGLSTDGLSRSDVKAVYRDIATRNFTYDKTAEVLSQTVPGLQIIQDELTPEELEELWTKNFVFYDLLLDDGRFYETELKTIDDAQWTGCEFDECVLRCYEGESLIWETSTKNFHIDGQALVSDGLAIWGKYPSNRDRYDSLFPWLGRLDKDGNILWEKEIRHDFENEDIEAVVDNGDGTWAVFSMANDDEYLCVRKFDLEGNELSLTKNKIDSGTYPIDVIRFKDGYLLQMTNNLDYEKGCLVRLDGEGNLLGYLGYEDENYVYLLEDMIEFGDKVYLSTYVIPKNSNNDGMDELAELLCNTHTDNGESISDEEITRMVQENYTAVLLMCDTEGGTPKNFYSVEGSMGSKLKVDGDKLCWDVETISSIEYLELSGYQMRGRCKIYRYVFDSNGIMIENEDTGVISGFAR